jgi:hypothetical protein
MVHDPSVHSGENGLVSTDRRTLVVVLVALAVAAPAAALRAMCVGRSCLREEPARTRVPFCSLPGELRDLLAAGFRDGRGPHLMAVAGTTPIRGATGVKGLPVPWPQTAPDDWETVPLVFAGEGVRAETEVPDGTVLDDVAPTIAEAIGLHRPHPGVRSGEAIPGLTDRSERPRLVVEVVWKGVGATALRADPTAWPTLRGIIEDHPGTLRATVGSLPLDPAAVLTTIGTGGLPRDHGITGTLVRNDRGTVVRGWGEASPFSVIAALGDDLDEVFDQEPRVGAVVTNEADRGVAGGTWYVDGDRDDLTIEPRPDRQGEAVARLLAGGYGRDDVPDLLAVVMRGPVKAMDRSLRRVVAAAEAATDGRVLVVVTATGPVEPDGIPAAEVESRVEEQLGTDVIEASATGGFFVDQEVLASTGRSDDSVVRALRSVRGPDGRPLFADVFPQVAVTFARYC